MFNRRVAFYSIIFILLTTVGCFAETDIQEKYFSDSATRDMQALEISRQAMADIVNYMQNTPAIFNTTGTKKKMSLDRLQRLSAWNTWQSFLDHILVMDSLGKTYSDIYKNSKDERKKKAFRISFAAFLAQYRYAIAFIDITEKNPDFHVVLNESVPELGLPENTYARLKYRFLNVIRGAEFARLNVVYRFYGKDKRLSITKWMDEDIDVIWEAGKGKGPVQTLQNGIRILQDKAFTTWFPVQKGISNLMSDIRVRRGHEFLISQEQIKKMIPELEPGDIMLQRREWCLTNIGLPGFWTHAALYIGTPEERRSFFNTPGVKEMMKTSGKQYDDFEKFLLEIFPDAYHAHLKIQKNNHKSRVIEAKGEGIIFTPLESSAYADSLVVLRPRLSRKEKAIAVSRAFHYFGRPYDFNFDFLTDATLVCSELIYKCYIPEDNIEGLNLPLSDLMGRKVLSPNNMARLFDEEYDKKPQMDYVLFFDGDEKKDCAIRSDVKIFRKSWERPKWHIVIKDSMLDKTMNN